MNAYADAMRRYASFSGRSSRSQYWLFILVYAVLLFVGLVIDLASGLGNERMLPITGTLSIAHFLPSLAVLVRRLHDNDQSGWLVLLAFVPLIGQIMLLVFACQQGTQGANRFGPAPKAHQSTDAMYGASLPRPEAVQQRSVADQLAQLGQLRADGVIDEAEFQRLKVEALQSNLR